MKKMKKFIYLKEKRKKKTKKKEKLKLCKNDYKGKTKNVEKNNNKKE